MKSPVLSENSVLAQTLSEKLNCPAKKACNVKSGLYSESIELAE